MDTLGILINNIFIRNQIDCSKSLQEFALKTKEIIIECYKHRFYPIDKVLKSLDISHKTGSLPITSIYFNGLNLTSNYISKEEWESYLSNLSIDLNFDLNCYCNIIDNKLILRLDYKKSIFSAGSVKKILDIYLKILNVICSSPETNIRNLHILNNNITNNIKLQEAFKEFEQEKLLKNVKDCFEIIVDEYGDNIAVKTTERDYTYNELNKVSNIIAHNLTDNNHIPQHTVGIFIGHNINMITSILAVVKTNNIYIPLDIEYPTERINSIILDANIETIITDNNNIEIIKQVVADRAIEIININNLKITDKTHNTQLAISPQDLIYILYTSGSTGTPKGVMQNHAYLLHLTYSFTNSLHIKQTDCITLIPSFSFSASVMDLFGALLNGASLFLVDVKNHGLDCLAKNTATKGITIYHSVPTVYRFFTRLITQTNDVSNIRLVYLAGEPLLKGDVEKYRSVFSDKCILVNGLGCTEYNICRQNFINKQTEIHTDVVPLGFKAINTEIVILDEEGLPVVGTQIGEIAVKSKYLSPGYWNDNTLTQKKITEVNGDGQRLYHTGDIGRFKLDGSLVHIGRKDFQVKIRGQRIELAEIEVAISQIESVAEAVVVVKHINADDYICAYYTASAEISDEKIKKNLNAILPKYMVPSFCMQMETFPKTSTGKINKLSLPQPVISENEGTVASNVYEVKLLEICQNILNNRKITIGDNFFTVGGHSLTAMQLIARIHKECNVRLQLKDIFMSANLKELAYLIRESQNDIHCQIAPVTPKNYYPLTAAQKRLYFLQEFDQLSVAYNTTNCFELTGNVDLFKVESVFIALIDRHESLRTSFTISNKQPVQVVHKDFDFAIQHINNFYDTDVDEIIKNFIKPFDLSKAPLLRVGVIHKQDDVKILVIDMHHIITDGSSMNIIINDFISLYKGNVLPGLHIQYKEYAEWYNSDINYQRLQTQKKYWLEEFNDEVPVLELPTDYNRPPIQAYIGKRLEFELGKDITKLLYKIAKEEGATLYMVMFAVFNVFLSKISSQEDIVVGTPTAGRNHADITDIVGMFVNTLAIRTKPSGEKPFITYLHECKSKIINAFENQDYPYEELVDTVIKERDTSRNPLFDIMFTLQNYADIYLKYDIPGIAIEKRNSNNNNSLFDLTLECYESEAGLKCIFEYNTSLFKQTTIVRLIELYKNCVSSVVLNNTSCLKNIQIISEKEKEVIRYKFNENKLLYDKDIKFHQFIEKWAKEASSEIACVFNNDVLTYNDLNAKANQFAHYLLGTYNLQEEEVVALHMKKSLDLIISIIGILKAGGAYLPIDINYPIERKLTMLEVCKVKLIIANNDISIPDVSVEIFSYESISGYSSDEVSKEISPNHLAYVIFTSGSTGIPKGVMVEHTQLVNTVLAWNKAFDLDKIRVSILQLASISFDVFCGDLGKAFSNKGKLVIVPEEQRLDLQSIYTMIIEHGITLFETTPAFALPLMNYIDNNGLTIGNLKLLLLGSDILFMEDYKYLLRKFSDRIRVINTYGITETTIDSSYYEEKIDILPEIVNTPIGKPLANNKILILDKYRNIVPIGFFGELYIGGDSVSRGYFGNEELTKERFMFIGNERLYQTGDMGRWLADGNIEFLKRTDLQVKIRGYRIEIGEIESNLKKIARIENCVVDIRTNKYGDKYLCAYYVSKTDIESEEMDIFLKGIMPEYMVPEKYMRIERIPTSINGKINRKELPEPIFSQNIGFFAPNTKIEKEVVNIVSNLLLIDQGTISIYDDFFSLGGNSLRAMLFVNEVHERMNIKLKLQDIFTSPKIKDISNKIELSRKIQFSEIGRTTDKSYYPLSSAQKRLYVLHQLNPDSTAYNSTGIFEICGSLQTDRLQEAFSALIKRHESLRTSFDYINGMPVQRIKHWEEQIDISVFEHETEQNINAITKTFVKPFDLSLAPLIRLGLIKLNDKKHLLLIDMHHIVIDGMSMSILVKDFAKLYNKDTLPQQILQYKDFSEWQNSKDIQEKLKEQENYWLGQFSGNIPLIDLPTDYLRPTAQNFEGSRAEFEVDANFQDLLYRIARNESTTTFMVLFAVYNVFLSKITEQEDIIVGTPVAGRNHANTQDIVGIFINTLALRNQPCREKTFFQFLADVKQNAISAFDNQDFPYEDLIDMLGLNRDTGRNPLFDCMFVMQNIGDESIILEGLTIRPYQKEYVSSKFDLSLHVEETGEKLKFYFEYSTTLFKNETINAFISCFKHLLGQCIENGEKQLCALNFLSKEEEKQVLNMGTGKKVAIAQKSAFELFEHQVANLPDKIAIISGEKSATYSVLNEHINKISDALLENDINENSIVALVFDPSIEMIASILAVLKTEAAFVPIDPDMPEERIEFILTDVSSSLLLTNKHIKEYGIPVICIGNLLIPENTDKLNFFYQSKVTINSRSHIIYTSGTTGRPKGVELTHGNLINYVNWISDTAKIGINDSSLLLSSYSFDLGYTALFPTILNGGTLHLLSKEQYLDTEYVVKYIKSNKISYIKTTPSFLNEILKQKHLLLDNKYLRMCILGGEPISMGDVKLLNTILPGIDIINHYGPTETTVGICAEIIDRSNLEKYNNKSIIGTPCYNNTIVIINKYNNICPVGVWGELCISGKSVAKGYLNRPRETQEKFIRDINVFDGLLYYTGDLARWTKTGKIELKGRKDNQIKLNGYRIELDEIKNTIKSYNGIRDAVAILREINDKKLIVAYVIKQIEVSVKELKKYIESLLPHYMLPSYILFIDNMPLTRNGKIDMTKLPLPMKQLPAVDHVLSELEFEVGEIIKSVLNTDRCETIYEQSFFEMGGNSLKAIQLINKINIRFQANIQLKDIYRNGSIKEISLLVNNILDEKKIEHITKIPEKPYYLASNAQYRIYTVQQLNPDNTSYNKSLIFKLQGQNDEQKITCIVQALIDRHESLRTSYHVIKNKLYQKIHPKGIKPKLEYLSIENNDYENAVKLFISPFDLHIAPLLRIGIINVNSTEQLFIIDTHHITSDGISSLILIEEFAAMFKSEILPEKTIEYKDYSEWITDTDNELLHKQHSFWQNEISHGYVELDIPFDFERPAKMSHTGDIVRFRLDESDTAIIKKVANSHNVSLYCYLLSCFKIFISKLDGKQKEIAIGTVLSGRSHPDLDRIVGMFVNILPVKTYPANEKMFSAYLNEVNEKLMHVIKNQNYPYERLIETVINRSSNRNALFDIVFELQTDYQLQDNIDALKIEVQSLNNKTSKFDLSFIAIDKAYGIEFEVEYSTELFKKETISEIIECFTSCLMEITLNPQQTIGDVVIHDNNNTADEQDELTLIDAGFSF
jgi:amino acid adenylation domain-containing protein